MDGCKKLKEGKSERLTPGVKSWMKDDMAGWCQEQSDKRKHKAQRLRDLLPAMAPKEEENAGPAPMCWVQKASSILDCHLYLVHLGRALCYHSGQDL